MYKECLVYRIVGYNFLNKVKRTEKFPEKIKINVVKSIESPFSPEFKINQLITSM